MFAIAIYYDYEDEKVVFIYRGVEKDWDSIIYINYRDMIASFKDFVQEVNETLSDRQKEAEELEKINECISSITANPTS